MVCSRSLSCNLHNAYFSKWACCKDNLNRYIFHPNHCINFFLYPFGPFQGFLAMVKSLPWNSFAKMNRKFFIAMIQGFINQLQHLNIRFNANGFAEICQAVKKVATVSAEMYRYNVALVLNGFYNKTFLPGQIHYLAFDFA